MGWFAGCASGEEVYTFKILCEDLRNADTHFPDIFILATDINPEYLSRAKEAVYTRSSMKGYQTNLLNLNLMKIARLLLKNDLFCDNHLLPLNILFLKSLRYV
ncbi:MAG: hypothetical protein KJO34_15120 [Deltaproteobacteria bacterium]|nr:hypothetical protein [Deltaproteobacteria bacterium]